MKLRHPYENHDAMSDLTALICMDPSLAQQHQKDETDINLIVRKYITNGTEIPLHNRPPLPEDFQQVESMQEAMQLVVDAKDAFMEQPAEVRARFNNDPATFVEFCGKEENYDDMRKLGLLNEAAEARWQADQTRLRLDQEAALRDAEAYRASQKTQK